VTWKDLVAITIALEVTIFDLVLPHPDDEAKVVVARTSRTDQIERSDGTTIPRTVAYEHRPRRSELGKLLFGLPGEWLTPEQLEILASRKGFDLADALSDIHNVEEGLQATIAKVNRLIAERDEENTDGIDS